MRTNCKRYRWDTVEILAEIHDFCDAIDVVLPSMAMHFDMDAEWFRSGKNNWGERMHMVWCCARLLLRTTAVAVPVWQHRPMLFDITGTAPATNSWPPEDPALWDAYGIVVLRNAVSGQVIDEVVKTLNMAVPRRTDSVHVSCQQRMIIDEGNDFGWPMGMGHVNRFCNACIALVEQGLRSVQGRMGWQSATLLDLPNHIHGRGRSVGASTPQHSDRTFGLQHNAPRCVTMYCKCSPFRNGESNIFFVDPNGVRRTPKLVDGDVVIFRNDILHGAPRASRYTRRISVDARILQQ